MELTTVLPLGFVFVLLIVLFLLIASEMGETKDLETSIELVKQTNSNLDISVKDINDEIEIINTNIATNSNAIALLQESSSGEFYDAVLTSSGSSLKTLIETDEHKYIKIEASHTLTADITLSGDTYLYIMPSYTLTLGQLLVLKNLHISGNGTVDDVPINAGVIEISDCMFSAPNASNSTINFTSNDCYASNVLFRPHTSFATNDYLFDLVYGTLTNIIVDFRNISAVKVLKCKLSKTVVTGLTVINGSGTDTKFHIENEGVITNLNKASSSPVYVDMGTQSILDRGIDIAQLNFVASAYGASIRNVESTSIALDSAIASYISMEGCSIGSAVTIANKTNIIIKNCSFTNTLTVNGCVRIRFECCNFSSTVTVDGNTSYITFENCIFNSYPSLAQSITTSRVYNSLVGATNVNEIGDYDCYIGTGQRFPTLKSWAENSTAFLKALVVNNTTETDSTVFNADYDAETIELTVANNATLTPAFSIQPQASTLNINLLGGSVLNITYGGTLFAGTASANIYFKGSGGINLDNGTLLLGGTNCVLHFDGTPIRLSYNGARLDFGAGGGMRNVIVNGISGGTLNTNNLPKYLENVQFSNFDTTDTVLADGTQPGESNYRNVWSADGILYMRNAMCSDVELDAGTLYISSGCRLTNSSIPILNIHGRNSIKISNSYVGTMSMTIATDNNHFSNVQFSSTAFTLSGDNNMFSSCYFGSATDYTLSSFTNNVFVGCIKSTASQAFTGNTVAGCINITS